MSKIPQHVAIIMDGNGRWAKERGLPRVSGHAEGAKRVREIICAASESGVKYLTLYTFSTENWNRPKAEVEFLMQLLSQHLDSELKELKKNNVRFQFIGDIAALPRPIQEKIERFREETSHSTGLTLTLALSYSGRTEIVQAARRISEDVLSQKMKPEEITAETFSRYLYTKDMPDPDLLIRTSGECRLSNFLLWQMSYSEIYITETYWPDFKKEDFLKALEDYGTRERRFGLVKSAR